MIFLKLEVGQGEGQGFPTLAVPFSFWAAAPMLSLLRSSSSLLAFAGKAPPGLPKIPRTWNSTIYVASRRLRKGPSGHNNSTENRSSNHQNSSNKEDNRDNVDDADNENADGNENNTSKQAPKISSRTQHVQPLKLNEVRQSRRRPFSSFPISLKQSQQKDVRISVGVLPHARSST